MFSGWLFPVSQPISMPDEEQRALWKARAERANYINFRTETFRAGVAAGTISPLLPADTLDRWLDRAWVVVNKPLDEDKLKEIKTWIR